MSTRCTIIINKDNKSELINIYRHDDGYPECTGEEIKEFCKQADWDLDKFLALLETSISKYTKKCRYKNYGTIKPIEPVPQDLNYVYMIHMLNKTITAYETYPFGYNPELLSVINNHQAIPIA